jgi:hypothetical protein
MTPPAAIEERTAIVGYPGSRLIPAGEIALVDECPDRPILAGVEVTLVHGNPNWEAQFLRQEA